MVRVHVKVSLGHFMVERKIYNISNTLYGVQIPAGQIVFYICHFKRKKKEVHPQCASLTWGLNLFDKINKEDYTFNRERIFVCKLRRCGNLISTYLSDLQQCCGNANHGTAVVCIL